VLEEKIAMTDNTRHEQGNAEQTIFLKDGREVRIREVRGSDADLFMTYFGGLSAQSRDFMHGWSAETACTREHAQRLAAKATSDSHRAAVALSGTPPSESMVGYCWIDGIGGTGMPMLGIGVVDLCHEVGLGRILLRLMLRRARSLGHPRVRLGVWADNMRAIHVYGSVGFRIDPTAPAKDFNGRIELYLVAETAEAMHTSLGPSPHRLGVDFTRLTDNPLTTIISCDPWDANGDPLKAIPGAAHPSVLYFPDGRDGYRFWMVFTPPWKLGSFPGGAPPAPIPHMDKDWWWERCTLVRSMDGVHWEKTKEYLNPLIHPGCADAWDGGWHCDPDVVYTPDRGPGGSPRWFLYYCGNNSKPYGMSIGLAISDDGLHYTKVGDSGPLQGHIFQGDQWRTRCPAAVYDVEKGKFQLWYNWGPFEIGYATSDDGVHWAPYHPERPGEWGYVVLRPTPGTFDACGITHQDVIYHDGLFWMYYHALAVPRYAWLQIGLATSTDGIHWTKHPEPILVPGANPWEQGSLYHPSPVVVDGKMYLYYCGATSFSAYPLDGDMTIGLAISPP
jgi:ribosomal protein S18 acetylase RimI-like enzyme